MRSLSPGPRRYSSPTDGGGCPCFLSSSPATVTAARGAPAAGRGAIEQRTVTPTIRNVDVCFMVKTSVLIGRRAGNAAAPVHDGPRHGLALERFGVDRVSGIAGGPDRDTERCREFVVLDARNEAVDHARRMLEVGIEQDER